jgi:hypothetical protein
VNAAAAAPSAADERKAGLAEMLEELAEKVGSAAAPADRPGAALCQPPRPSVLSLSRRSSGLPAASAAVRAAACSALCCAPQDAVIAALKHELRSLKALRARAAPGSKCGRPQPSAVVRCAHSVGLS